MEISLLLLILPAVVLSAAPSDWGCKPLTRIEASAEGCVDDATYFNGVWDISTTKVGSNINMFCVITLTGDDVHKSADFYVKGTFSNSAPAGSNDARIGPYGGITFNMEDADNGNANYVMMRLKNPGGANVEIGRLNEGVKSSNEAKASTRANAAVTAGSATLEILVRDGQETVYIDGVVHEEMSDYQPFYVAPGSVGFGFQNAKSWTSIRVAGAEVCSPVSCADEDGTIYSGGDSWEDDEGRTCTCSAAGINCVCGDDTLTCAGGTQKWVDPDTCEAKCIRDPAHCSSSGDPHYRTFDGKYYDFHGECSYQAASCGEFVVQFKNIDFYNRAPRYTKRIELEFKGQTFAIANGYSATVDGAAVQVPYIKTYTNGDRVEIVNNGQLEIRLYNKGRNPSVRLRANNAGSYINAEMWLHGSCADITEGLCGNWNGNSGDDLIGNNGNTHGETYKEYDEDCPAPPPPYHPCDDIDGHEAAAAICDDLKSAPFTACHGTVSIGDADEGIYRNCMVDICNCFIDSNCACSQYDSYAQTCINNGIDLSDWRHDVAYCPFDCPDGLVYQSAGATPVPTCLDKDPEQTGTVRGCFCPTGQYLQDNVCIDGSECQCLYEGQFYDNGDEIRKEGEGLLCTCRDAGEMVCEDIVCPELNCDDDEIEARMDDVWCPYCDDSWVEALNPEETIKKGQSVVLTCAVHAEGVRKKDIKWYKDGQRITEGVSNNKRRLTISDADADDHGTYTCEATKDGKVGEDTFDVEVVMPAVCEHEDGTNWEEGTIYNPQDTEACECDAKGEHTCACIDDGEECEDPTPVVWFDDSCMKTCVAERGLCQAAADPHYETFDGTQFDFKGDCIYNFFSCGDVAMIADHVKDEASTKTRSLEVSFKTDTFKLEGNQVTLNGEAVTVPLHKTYNDGSVLSMSDVGTYTLSIVQDGKDPLVELVWDKVSSYSVNVHGSCKGLSTGVCGSWNDDASDDLTMPNGDVADTVEEFATAWAQDDEEDCPEPEPPLDLCVEFGLEGDKAAYEDHVRDVLGAGSLKQCSRAMDTTETVDFIVQQICGCFGDLNCGCPLLEQFATQCDADGYDISNWRMDNKHTVCAPDCPTGSVFKAKGPKPAPSCTKPNGGRKSQRGCFCPDGEVMEDGACMDVADCQCEYAGIRYDIGERYNKLCETCECVGAGQEECGEMECNPNCDDDEIEVIVEGECCPQCQGNWVVAVNPDAEGTVDQPLALICEVEGVEITADNVKWFKFDPGMDDITNVKKTYTISEDGLILTIKNFNEKKIGNYKCVVEHDGVEAEGVFSVTLPTRAENLIEPVNERVNFVDGRTLVLEVTKVEDKQITEIYWVCNGVRMENKVGNCKIKNTKTSSVLTLKPATLDDVGSCTCFASGVGTQDSEEIVISGDENEVTITPVETAITCTENKNGCRVKFEVAKVAGKVKTDNVKICRWEEEQATGCDKVKFSNGSYFKGMGNKCKLTDAGQYVCIHTQDGVETMSAPVTVTVNPKSKKG